MRRLIAILALGLGLVAGSALAGAPEALVRETTEKVLQTLEQNKELLQKEPEAVQGLVSELVLPHFDFELMSRLVLARNWREASPEQRQRFVEEFRQLLIRTYGTSLQQYSGQKVEFLPSKPDPDPKRALVRTQILQSDGPPIPVDYRLRETEEGWKVFDVTIEGISLVQNYRTSFASEISKDGLDALIERLRQRNSRSG
ncbi:MAG: ABC transporter substrate-binding protein [Xanthomonadaceae bacterium]|nr:ABC transporter substrate-binding protein [Xanthomonadaceae bacterium]